MAPDQGTADRADADRPKSSREGSGRTPSKPPARDGQPWGRDSGPRRGTGQPKGRDSGPRRGTGQPAERDSRPPRDETRPRPEAPPIPPEVKYEDLDKDIRARLRSLSKDNAEDVGRHLLMVGLLLEDDPETAYLHAQVAVSRGGRVDAVREVAALAAYTTGRYAEALRELRTVRRLSGSVEHLAMEADCERGLGRPERAVALSQSPEAGRLSPAAAVELQIVLAGARLDMKDPGAALLTLQRIVPPDQDAAERVNEAMVDALRALRRDAEADELESTLPDWDGDAADEVVVYDIEDETDEDAEKG